MPTHHNEQARWGGLRLTNTDPRRTAARPSLTGASRSDKGPISILASLESEPSLLLRRRRPNSRWLWIGAAALAGVVSFGYFFEGSPAAPPAEQPALADTHASARPVLPVAPAASTAAAEAASAVQASGGAPRGARIETVDASSPGHDPFAALAQEAPVPALASVTGAASASGGNEPSRAVRPVKTAAKATHPRVAAAKKGSTAATAKARPPRRADKRDDPDVDLLAALMAHVASPASSAPKPAGRRGAGSDKAGAHEDLSIAKLVTRCEAMQGLRAAECRRRICDGYWGKAQACPARRPPAKGEESAR